MIPRAATETGAAIRHLPARTGITVKDSAAELARRLGTTQSAIARLESGRVSPSFATLRRYAEATDARLTGERR